MKNLKYKSIPNCLRKYRRARGLKQKEVAKILGLKSTSQISRWEKGVCLPITLNLLDLAVLYRTTMDFLLGDLRRLRTDVLLKREEVLRTEKKTKNQNDQ